MVKTITVRALTRGGALIDTYTWPAPLSRLDKFTLSLWMELAVYLDPMCVFEVDNSKDGSGEHFVLPGVRADGDLFSE